MKNLFSYIVTFIVWTLLFWWEAASGAFISKFWFMQFLFACIYLISGTLYVPPYEIREVHNKIFGGLLFSLTSGFYLLPLIMWWGYIFKPKRSNISDQNSSHLYLDTRDLKEALIDYSYRNVQRKRELRGFWGAVEDFTRQYFGNLNFKDSWWIFVVITFLSFQLANYSMWFNKKFFPENFIINNTDSNRYIPEENLDFIVEDTIAVPIVEDTIVRLSDFEEYAEYDTVYFYKSNEVQYMVKEKDKKVFIEKLN